MTTHTIDIATLELSSLRTHIDHCNGCRERWFALRCAAESVHAFVAPRLFTTLVLVVAALGFGSLLF
ncbi:MAG: hypothetical protein ABIP61_07475 [Burkholderiaceae bacterium]